MYGTMSSIARIPRPIIPQWPTYWFYVSFPTTTIWDCCIRSSVSQQGLRMDEKCFHGVGVVRSSLNLKLWLLPSRTATKGVTIMSGVTDCIHHEELGLQLQNVGSKECVWSLEDSQGTSWYCHDWKNHNLTKIRQPRTRPFREEDMGPTDHLAESKKNLKWAEEEGNNEYNSWAWDQRQQRGL